MEEFPNLVKLQKKYGDKVAAVSVSVGLAPEDYYDDSLAFLKKEQATFANFMLDEDEEWYTALDVESGGVPAVLVYDQQGSLVAQAKDGFLYRDGKKIRSLGEHETYQEVNKVVEELVNK